MAVKGMMVSLAGLVSVFVQSDICQRGGSSALLEMPGADDASRRPLPIGQAGCAGQRVPVLQGTFKVILLTFVSTDW